MMTFDTKGAQSIQCSLWASRRGLHALGSHLATLPLVTRDPWTSRPGPPRQGAVLYLYCLLPLPVGTSDLPPHPVQVRQAYDLP